MVKLGVQEKLTWTAIEKEVATTFQVGAEEYVNNLRHLFLATGEVMVWERSFFWLRRTRKKL